MSSRDAQPPFTMDLLLLHAPSVYDFREKAILYGPVSDMVPSSTVFEMYPVGFLTIASYLHDRGMKVRVVNLALRMMNSRRFDVPRYLAGQKPRAVGIDLHWLPHAHGALEVARIVKELHPSVPVIMGGLSSSYFHRELIGYPQVDYVLRGDSTEPPLHQLLLALQSGAPLDQIPNLTWKDAAGIHVNPLSFAPMSLDYVDLRPDLMVEMVMRYRDLESTLPFNGWWNNPVTAVLTVKGCAFECVTCGSSHTTCTHLTQRQKPVYRSPASLVANMQAISRLTNGPIVLIGAFDNIWTLRVTQKLRFGFESKDGVALIVDRKSKTQTTWATAWDLPYEKLSRDYAIVARIHDSTTGQPVIIAAGISEEGTEAAGEILYNPVYLETLLSKAPPNWEQLNMEAVIETQVIEGHPGPPSVLAVETW